MPLTTVVLILFSAVVFAANVFGLPTVRLMSSGQSQLEGKVVVDYGNRTQYTVSSQGIGQYQADMLCQKAGYVGSYRIYRQSLCFDESGEFNGSMLRVLPRCQNWTDVSNCFKKSECRCCRKRYELALRCYDEGTIELESNKINNETDIVLHGLVTIYINGSWWTIDVYENPRMSCFVCNSIGLDNYNVCRISPTASTNSQYGSGRNVSGVAPYLWKCPYNGAGTIDKCNRSKVERTRPSKKLLTVKCLLPADNRLPNYSLCHDTQGTKTENECEEIPDSFEPTTVLNTASNNRQESKSNDSPVTIITIPSLVAVIVFIIMIIIVRKFILARRNHGDVRNYEEGEDML